MKQATAHDVGRILRDGNAIDQAIVATHRRVILRHRQMSVPLAVWGDGKVVELPPESVELPPNGERTDPQTGER